MTPRLFPEPQKADRDESAFLLTPGFSIERDLISCGCRIIAGVDEAGRGCLAGPLALGLTIYSTEFILEPDPEILSAVNDSKLLTPARRTKALTLIENSSLLTVTTMVSHRTIDAMNINRATEFALKRLLEGIEVKPDMVIMDGNFRFDVGIPYMAVKKGDRKSLSIASASIAAKVTRDRIMERLDEKYPGYDFRTNKGYGTRRHCDALQRLGPCSIHRRSYEPVKSMQSLHEDLFEKR